MHKQQTETTLANLIFRQSRHRRLVLSNDTVSGYINWSRNRLSIPYHKRKDNMTEKNISMTGNVDIFM